MLSTTHPSAELPTSISVLVWLSLIVVGSLCYLAPNSKLISLLVIVGIARLKVSAGMNFTLTFLGFCQVLPQFIVNMSI